VRSQHPKAHAFFPLDIFSEFAYCWAWGMELGGHSSMDAPVAAFCGRQFSAAEVQMICAVV
jgi:hypothetical protein